MAEAKNSDKKIEKEEHKDERIEQTGQVTLDESGKKKEWESESTCPKTSRNQNPRFK